MNPGQQRFHDFVMSMVQPGNEDAAEDILAKSFHRQDAGPLSPDDVDAVVAELTPLIQPDFVPQLQEAALRMKQMPVHGPSDHDHGDHEHDELTNRIRHDEPAGGLAKPKAD